MANNKTKAQIQIDVSFVTNATKLVKDLQGGLKGLNLSSVLTKDLSTGLNQGFKTLIGDLNKLADGLGKKGLNPKQYQDFFNQMNAKIYQSTGFVTRLGKELDDIFSSDANKQAIKSLDDYRKKLEELKKISIEYNKTNTRQGTAARKMFEETGIDYSISKKTIKDIYKQRQAGKNSLTKGQQIWYDQNNLDEGKLKRILELYKQMYTYEQKMENMRNQSNALSGKSNIDQGMKALERQIASGEKMVITVETYEQWQQVLRTVLPYLEQVAGLSGRLANDMDAELPKAVKHAEETAKAASTIREIMGQFGIVWSASTVVRGFQDLARSAFEFYKSLDSALNEIYVVSSLTSGAVSSLKNDFINMAKETGMALDDVTRSAVLFYQQGLNTDEVMEMTEVTSEFAKVAGIDATEAADKLTAAVNGYCLAAEDAALVADKFNKVAAASAADINELSTAFSKAAAQANQAGVGMDNYLAYIATMVEATREAPENIGTSLKTIFSRMQQVKNGESEDGTDINKVETALRSVNIALRDSSGQLRDLEEVFDELGPKWQSLDRNTQAYLGTIIAGTRQQSRFITLMQNWDRVLELSEDSAESAGQQALMHAKAMESIESKAEQLQVAWQEFTSNITSSETIKVIITGLTKLLDLFNDGTKPVTVMALAVGLLSSKMKTLSDYAKQKLSGVTNFFKLFQNKGQVGEFTDIKYKNGNIKQSAQTQLLKAEADLTQQQLTLTREITKLENERLSIQQQLNKGQGDTNQLTQREAQIEDEINKKKIEGNKLEQQKQQLKRGGLSSQDLSAVGMTVQTVGLMVSSLDANLGGAMSTAGSFITGLSQMMVNPVAGIASLTIGVIQLIEVWRKWDENIEATMTNAVDAVKNSLQDLNNKDTEIRTTKDLLEDYKELNSRIYRTAKEQEQLNGVIQELGDTHNIDVVADAYGNLSINIEEVNNKLTELENKRNDLADKLDKEEAEQAMKSIKGLGNNYTLEDFYTKLFGTSGSQYKSLLTGIEDGLTDESRNISRNVAETFSNNLEDAIYDEVKNNKYQYMVTGLAESMMQKNKEFKTNGLDSGDWNALYTEIATLQEDVDEMSFNEVQDHLQEFYNNWSGSNKLVQGQWELLVNSINNTVFGNNSLLQFYAKVEEAQKKATGEYYTDQLEQINKQQELINQQATKHNANEALATGALATGVGIVGGLAGGGKIGGVIGSVFGPLGTVGGAIAGAIIGAIGGGVIDALWETEEEKANRQLRKARKELEKQKKEYLEEVQKQHAGTLYSTQDAYRWIDAQYKLAESMKTLRGETQEYLGTISTLYDMENLTADQAVEYSAILAQIGKQVDGFSGTDAQRTSFTIGALTDALDDPALSEEVKEKIQAAINEAFNDLELPSNMSFTQLAQELESCSKNLITMNELMDEMNDKGGLTLDSFMELAQILDSIDISALYAVSDLQNGINYVDQYIGALRDLNLVYDDNKGLMDANGKAMQSLQTIQQVLTKSKLVTMKNELIARKTQIEAEMGYIDAQIVGTDTAIQTLEKQAGAEMQTADLIDEAQGATVESYTKKIEDLNKQYSTDIQNLNTWTRGVLNHLSTATEAWGRYWNAAAGNGTEGLDDLYDQAKKSLDNLEWEAVDRFNLHNYGETLDSGEQEELLQRLKDYRAGLVSLKGQYGKELESIELSIGTLDSLINADLSKFGLDGEDAKELDKYIGKLKEIYNILNRIQLLNHRLSVLDAYADIENGELYASHLKERMALNKELLKQHEFLVKEQKKFANGYREFIESGSFADVFDFDEYGQIIINFEKYNALQDTAADGQKSMKEQADELYDTYTEMFEELQGYFDDYISYLKAAIELNEEVMNNYVEMEKKAADTIKEIYQDILDTKLEAIDKEIEALDDLQKAREEAREDQENAKEVSGLQTNLQRAMFDTSGASDSAQIKARQDLNDKLDAIADDKYSEMLDNLKTQLEDQKDMLQEEFDEMFENIDWLYAMIESEFMGDKDKMDSLLSQSSDYQNATQIERQNMKKDWETKMNTIMTTLTGETPKSIYDLWDETQKMREATVKLDEALKTREVNVGVAVANAIAQGINASKSGGSGGGGGGGYHPIGSPDPIQPSVDPKINNPVKEETPPPYMGAITEGMVLEFDKEGYSYPIYDTSTGKNKRTISDGWGYDENLTVLTAPVWSKDLDCYVIRVQAKNYKNPFWIRASEDAHGLGSKLWFHQAGFGKGGNKYAHGGFIDYTGPAWVDGSYSHPEAVLNALQTEHFIKFTNALDNMYGQMGGTSTANSIMIDTISFNVDSMSSRADGEAAFDAFVNKFKEIGSQRGMKINNFKNIL